MADEPKRIIDLTEVSSVAAGDYIAMDSEDGGTKKVKASYFTGGSENYMWGAIQGDIEDQTDLATRLNAIEETLPNKADIDGYYDEMAVGSAEQLLSNTYESDSTPYLYRTSGGSIEIGNRVYEDAIVGASMPWNQLLDKSNYSPSSGVFTNNGDGSITANGTASENETFECRSGANIFTYNHVYYVVSNVNATEDGASDKYELMLLRVKGSGNNENIYGKSTVIKCTNPNSSTAANLIQIVIRSGYTAQNIKFVPQLFDLTLMFGSTIADYAYSLEQATAGSGIAYLKSYGFFLKDYYAYNAGGIQSVKTSAKKVVGFNQWDEQWELGTYNLNTGAKVASSSNIRCKNKIKIFPNTTYCFTMPSNTDIRFVYFDENENWCGKREVNTSSARGYTWTTPTNAHYMCFHVGGTTYNNNICINFHWDGERDGEFEAYEEHIYPLDSTKEWRGIYKLDANNRIYADGDIYSASGEGTIIYGNLNLGSINWTKTEDARLTSGYLFVSSADIANKLRNNLDMINSRYVLADVVGLANVIDKYGANVNKIMFTATNQRKIYIIDSTYSDATTFKTALDGTYLVYKTETPTTESADPYTNPQWVDNWGTEQFVDERDVPVPVGHDSRYLPDLKAKVESAPNNPSTNGKYFLQYQNGEATYVPVPSEVPEAPSEDGTYVLKATVSGGTATLSWVAEE